jgi:hypothetical protein
MDGFERLQPLVNMPIVRIRKTIMGRRINTTILLAGETACPT